MIILYCNIFSLVDYFYLKSVANPFNDDDNVTILLTEGVLLTCINYVGATSTVLQLQSAW